MPVKECTQCKLSKPCNEFPSYVQISSGKKYTYYRAVCIECKSFKAPITEKFCKECRTTKPVSEFQPIKRYYKDNTYTTYQTYCRVCDNELRKQWYHKRNGTRFESQRQSIGPVSWNTMRGESTLEKHKEYPICKEGHSYVGSQCLLCKYSLQSTTKMSYY